MIPPSPARLEPDTWQRELAEAVSDPAELLRLLDLDAGRLPRADLGTQAFGLRVPRYFVGLMRRGDPDDPLLAQVLPTRAERRAAPGFVSDPVGDLEARIAPGMLHKYHGRVLAITTGACAVHCRYCFRRHFPYAGQASHGELIDALDVLGRQPGIDELVLSGGDPLSLSDRRLQALLTAAERHASLLRLRIHTRLPVVLPSRVTDGLCRLLGSTRLRVVVVIHANHPNEINPVLGDAMAALATAGATLLNQSVLLKSVNDDADTLVELSEALFGIGVLPYYLHLLDPVAGAAHFDVSEARARRLQVLLRERLPGYLVPRVVRETAGARYKSPLA